MVHPLEQKLVGLRRRVRPMAAIHGLFIAATVLLGIVVVVGSLDYLFRIQDRGLRIIASLVVLGVCGWTVYRRIGAVLRMRLGSIELAGRVQRQFPFLGDQIVTAVEFLHTADDDPAAGSVALRRTVIARATAEAEGLDFSKTLDYRPLLRAGALVALTYAAAVLFLIVPNLPATEIALKRLLNPFGNTSWPDATNLPIRRPVDPPAVESLSIRLIPPAYTGKPAGSSERFIRAIVGTRVQIGGKATKPLNSADLCFEDGRKIPARLGEDGCTFTVAWVVEKSGGYWFALTDREGLHGGGDDRWEIRATADAPPIVQIEQPRADLFVTPQAVTPIRVSAKDDLALRDVALVFHRTETKPETTLRLFSGPPQPPPLSEPNPVGDSRVIDYRWNLATLNLQPGEQVAFYATAGDYMPQTGKSEPRRLVVVTPDELRDRIADRERLIVAELERALKMQRECRSQVESSRIRLGDLRRFEQSDVDRLETAEHAQREVNQLLANRGEGVPVHILALLADLENNGIDNADARQRMNALLEELDRLNRELIPPLGRELTAAMKMAQVDREGRGGAAAVGIAENSLTAVAATQDAIIAALERQIERLGRWDSYRRLHRDIAQLLRDQEDAAHRTSEVGRRTLTRELRDLPPQDVADLHAAAARQLELARLLDRVLQEADQGAVELRKSDPLAADFVADALDDARRLAISGQMRDAGAQIQQNRIGQAAAAQGQIAHDLQEVLDILANRRENELDRLVKKLRAVEADLSVLEERQADLHKQIEAAANDKNAEARDRKLQRLGSVQRQLREETERVSRATRAIAGRAGRPSRRDGRKADGRGRPKGRAGEWPRRRPKSRRGAAIAGQRPPPARRPTPQVRRRIGPGTNCPARRQRKAPPPPTGECPG